MLDTIAYIPTILAYAFILLLLMILTFIVIYVSHKVYISIYDNLPVLSLHNEDVLSRTSDPDADYEYDNSYAKRESLRPLQQMRKSKTALRIIVQLEPCFLAYIILHPTTNKFNLPSMYNELEYHHNQSNSSHNHAIVKYFDRLSAIPMTCMKKQRDSKDEERLNQNQINRLESGRPSESTRTIKRASEPEESIRPRNPNSSLLVTFMNARNNSD